MKEKKYLLFGIGVVLISLVGISLAYFATQIVGKEKDISVNTKDLRIIFNNGDAITGENVVAEDNWSMTKTFSVENKSNSTYKYNIVIKDLINTFKTTGYLQYKITSTDGGYNMTSFEDVPKSTSAKDIVLAYSVSIEKGMTQNYTITIQYLNDENIDQSDDMGAKLNGNLFIAEGTEEPHLITEAILRDNSTISERTDFSVTNVANTTGTIYQTNKTEDGSTVYYYSGNTTNNWVKFGKETNTECTYNGEKVLYATVALDNINYYHLKEDIMPYSYTAKNITSNEECTSTNVCVARYAPIVGITEEDCNNLGGSWKTEKATVGTTKTDDIYWRIIRTNEDGSIRLLYVGPSHDTTSGYIGKQPFEFGKSYDYLAAHYSFSMYVGYMYGYNFSLKDNRTNEFSSTIKTYIDNWYESNLLTNYDNYLSKTAIYCNDRSTQNNSYSTKINFDYASNTRLDTNKTPTYKCGGNTSNGLFESTQAVEDKFSVSTEGGGNGLLKYPIALMTADEVSFAGGTGSTELSSPYAWYYTNSVGESVVGDLDENYNSRCWWTLSPKSAGSGSPMVFCTIGEANPGYLGANSVEESIAVRPAISLSPCVKVTGSGTPENPYVVDYDKSCN